MQAVIPLMFESARICIVLDGSECDALESKSHARGRF